ncbi:cysteine-rich receptor-like protein kinase 3 [Neltuma alba]|uniref:cysteine-rich receptor-like protein kinase 3 n=1 Tax=Neltuma alba TaxID=207710 RepID=UPI0010A554FB|nr:cysteine-rich receptor-like protein kinase 3 [Prosopis alba]
MLRPSCLLPLLTFIFWSRSTLNGVVSDPQTNLLKIQCNPFNEFFVTNISIYHDNLNATFQAIREQISDQNKHFATAQQQRLGENPIITLFQCRNYLTIPDCVACFDAAAIRIRSCVAAVAPGAHVVYDGCFLRYNSNGFFDETTQPFNFVSCGNQTTGDQAITTTVRQVLMNLQITTPRMPSFFAATKINVPNNNNGTNIYAFAQCVETITTDGCLDCLKGRFNSIEICLPFSDGNAFDAGCFLRYSTTSFFNDTHTIDITPIIKQGSSKKGVTIGGVVGGLALVLILVALFAWTRRPRRNKRVPRGDMTGASKLKGLATYNYNDLVYATKNFSEEYKLGEGGFGVVYKGTMKNGKVVAIKKLTLQQSRKMEEDFESEVMLISNVHHRNLVRLLGYCSEGHDRILIYEYMKNSSFDKFLFEKADVYSYGVVMLEVISGQKSTELRLDNNDEGAFLLQKAWKLYEKDRHLELVDNTLDPNAYDAEEVKRIIEIGLLCIQASADRRPMMSEIVVLLQNKDLLENITPTMPILIEAN